MKNKLNRIVKGFIGDKPVEEGWFQARLEACGTCEYNTENMEQVSIVDSLKMKIPTCSRVCTACGCCIDQKASVKEEVCGLVELGKDPKWTAIATSSQSSSGIKVTADSRFELTDVSTGVAIRLETSDKVVKVPLQISAPFDFEVIDVRPTCGCTAETTKKLKNNLYDLTLSVSTLKFKRGVESTKTVSIKYQKGSNVLSMSLYLKILFL